MEVEHLRSPHEKVGGIVYFGRMIDKIRLHAAGQLPPDYRENLGGGFDERCADFLKIDYAALAERVKTGGTDDEILEWCFQQGRKPDDDEIEVWNEFMRKRGWKDEMSQRLQTRLRDCGFVERTDIETLFDFIDLDEGRDPRQ